MTTTTLGIPLIAGTDLVQNGPTQIDAGFTAIDGLLPHVVTSLPSTPTDGQLIDYVADATNGVLWCFRLRAGSASPHKWEFAGGATLIAESTFSPVTGTSNSTPSTFFAPTTANQITVPFDGDYEVTAQAVFYSSSVANASIQLQVANAAAPTVPLLASGVVLPPAASGCYSGGQVTSRIAGLSAGTTLEPVTAFNQASVAWTCAATLLKVIPVRIG